MWRSIHSIEAGFSKREGSKRSGGSGRASGAWRGVAWVLERGGDGGRGRTWCVRGIKEGLKERDGFHAVLCCIDSVRYETVPLYMGGRKQGGEVMRRKGREEEEEGGDW